MWHSILLFHFLLTFAWSKPGPVVHQGAFTPKTPPFPSFRSVYTEPTTITGGLFRISGNFIKFPQDVQSTINNAKAEKKPLELFAVHMSIGDPSGSISLVGIPKLRIFAKTCTFPSSIELDVSAPKQTASPPPTGTTHHNPASATTVAVPIFSGVPPRGGSLPPRPEPLPFKGGSFPSSFPTRDPRFATAVRQGSSTPPKAANGLPGGEIEIFCGHVSSIPSSTIRLKSTGSNGISGGRGGNGSNGRDGTPGVEGGCKKKKFLFIRIRCDRKSGRAGIPSTNGSNGAKGGDGGDGGKGGSIKFSYNSITASTSIVADNKGGVGGSGGFGGSGGKSGKFIAPISYVTSCSSRCNARRTSEVRPPLIAGRSGPRGTSGKTGAEGIFSFAPIAANIDSSVSDDDFFRFVLLAERYYHDLMVSNGSCQEAMSVMSFISKLVQLRPRNSLLQVIGQRAFMSMKGVQLRKSIPGPAALSRVAPISIGEELKEEMRYAEALQRQIGTLQLQSNILAFISDTAAISIPKTDFAAIRRNLQDQRDIFRRAVLDIETRLEHAVQVISFEVEGEILSKKDEIDRARKGKFFKAIISVVNIGVGIVSLDVKQLFKSTKSIIGTLKGLKVSFDDIKEKFGEIGDAAGEIEDVLKDAVKVGENIKTLADGEKSDSTPGCSFQDLKKLLTAAPDRITKFPNLVDFNSDFASIRDIGVVGELSSALLASRAKQFTAQFSCLFGESLNDVPKVQAAVENYFILAAGRLEILGRMVDIDIELQQLKIIEDGVNAQRDHLMKLKSNIGSTTKSSTLVATMMNFENARRTVIDTIFRLAGSFGNIVLKDLTSVIKAYGNKRLAQNGVLGFNPSIQYSNLVRLENDLKDSFRSSQRCFASREVPTVSYYSFDITPDNSPDLFEGGLATGPSNRSSIVLDINKNCAFYAGNHPPSRMITGGNRFPICIPNDVTFNSRMVSIALELIGGDESLLPSSRSSLHASLDQVGQQSFRATSDKIRNYDMAPLQIGLGFIRLVKDGPPNIHFHSTCVVNLSGLDSVNIDSPRVCPSPFSKYTLQLGFHKEQELENYLQSVKAIRIHTRLVSYTRSSTANLCFGS